MTKKQQEYNLLLKRIGNAEAMLNNIDLLRVEGKAPREDDYYINAFVKLVLMLGEKSVEVEKELGRKMTYEERHRGFSTNEGRCDF